MERRTNGWDRWRNGVETVIFVLSFLLMCRCSRRSSRSGRGCFAHTLGPVGAPSAGLSLLARGAIRPHSSCAGRTTADTTVVAAVIVVFVIVRRTGSTSRLHLCRGDGTATWLRLLGLALLLLLRQ
jgi:hypothetical protein